MFLTGRLKNILMSSWFRWYSGSLIGETKSSLLLGQRVGLVLPERLKDGLEVFQCQRVELLDE